MRSFAPIRAVACGLLLQALGSTLVAQGRPFPLAVAVRVPVPPAPIVSGQDRYLCYELVLSSYLSDTVRVRRLDVVAVGSQEPLVRYQGEELADAMSPPTSTLVGEARVAIAAGAFKRVYVWVPIPAGRAVPEQLINRLTFEAKGPDGIFEDAVEHPVAVGPARSVIALGPPLKGGPWAVFNGPSNSSGHRRTPLVLNGRDALAQRYAIDYMLLADNGRTFVGDSTRNESYPGNGAEVIAVAEAVVSRVHQGVAENRPFITTRPDPFTLQTVIGNQVMLDLGQGRFALYAHLLPGSITVKVGDRVSRGQILGRVGNTGNSGAPHLHFHVVDANVPLGAEGLPYLIDTFDLIGSCGGTLRQCTVGAARTLSRSTPLRDQVVRFR